LAEATLAPQSAKPTQADAPQVKRRYPPPSDGSTTQDPRMSKIGQTSRLRIVQSDLPATAMTERSAAASAQMQAQALEQMEKIADLDLQIAEKQSEVQKAIATTANVTTGRPFLEQIPSMRTTLPNAASADYGYVNGVERNSRNATNESGMNSEPVSREPEYIAQSMKLK